MGLRKLWQKYGEWVAVLIVLSIVTVFTVWFLKLAPQYIPRFALTSLIGVLIGLFFLALLASRRKYRVRLREFLIKYRAKVQERGGLFYRYGRIFNAVMITVLLAFSLALTSNPEILDIQYIPYLVFALFIAFLISAVVFIASFLRVAGKWGILLIIIVTVIAGLRILLWRLSV